MNITDVSAPVVPPYPNDQANTIFTRQEELESKYWKIENRFAPFIQPNDRKAQVLIKDFLWRAIEEVAESIEAENSEESHEKVQEELADGLHFVTGLCVVLQQHDVFMKGWENYCASQFIGHDKFKDLQLLIEAAGTLGNCLKMKPWKQTDVLTDEAYFYNKLEQYVYQYLMYCRGQGLNPPALYSLYWRKSEVNLFRIRSNY